MRKQRRRQAPQGGKKKRSVSAAVPKAAPVTSAHAVVAGADLVALDFIEKSWPGCIPAKVHEAFADLRAMLRQASSSAEAVAAARAPWPPKEEGGTRYFDALDLIRRTLRAHDLLFLSRQVTYHIATSADLPMGWADVDQVHHVFSQIIEHVVRRAARSSRISIGLSTFSLRSGPGIEISFSSVDRHLSEVDRHAFLTELFQDKIDEMSGISLSDCRQIAVRQRGQLWVDLPKPNRPSYHLVLPLSPEAQAQAAPVQQTFKYDISIANYADMRKRFGIKKSQSLVTQIEHYVRSLVRYPIDVVMALSDKGIITTIYETQRGTAQSVASRISQRLGAETFRIGKKQVEVAFSYHLSPLSTSIPKGGPPLTKSPGH